MAPSYPARSFLTLGALLLAAGRGATAKQCVAFDTSGTLYAFGGTNDVSLGDNSTWSSPSAKTLTTSGRPSWTGANTQCFLSEYNNALYVLNADDTSDVYIFNFADLTWSSQSTSSSPSLNGSASLLDHDTNVIYTLTSAGELYDLDFSNVTTAATSAPLPWNDVGKAGFSTSGYEPVMAEASQHIVFFGVPNVDSGSAPLFVIHFSYFQPAAQAFNATSGSNFPDSHGVATGIPTASTGVAGEQIAFIPDDFSNTYVVTHWTNPGDPTSLSDAPSGITPYINTTQSLPAPTSHDTSSVYAASDTSLVQLDSSGNIYYMTSAFGGGQFAVSSSAKWEKMDYAVQGLSGGSSNSSGGSTSSSSSGSTSASGSRSSGGSSSGSGSTSGAADVRPVLMSAALALLGAAATYLL